MIKKACCTLSTIIIVLMLALDSGSATAQGNQERELLDIENKISSAFLSESVEDFFPGN